MVRSAIRSFSLVEQVNGIVMGGLDWVYSMLTMWMSNAVCLGMLAWYGRDGHVVTLSQIWWTLAAFMGTQVVAGITRYESRMGVWSVLRDAASSPVDEKGDNPPTDGNGT
jgi:hypothetical protein